MKKLITSGCSFTRYHWLTWFDYLKWHYKDPLNLAKPGAGHQYIARQIFEADIDQDTVVIIMWSEYDRLDYQSNGEWKTQGYGRINANYFDDIDSDHMFKNMVETMYAVNAYCKNKNVEVHNFMAFTFEWDYSRKISCGNYHLLDDLNLIYPDLYSFKTKNPSTIKLNSPDIHPLPSEAYYFYSEVMCPYLKLVPKELDKQLLEDFDFQCNQKKFSLYTSLKLKLSKIIK